MYKTPSAFFHDFEIIKTGDKTVFSDVIIWFCHMCQPRESKWNIYFNQTILLPKWEIL